MKAQSVRVIQTSCWSLPKLDSSGIEVVYIWSCLELSVINQSFSRVVRSCLELSRVV